MDKYTEKKKLQFVDLRLQNGQVELVLRALELYGYNLKFMINDNDITSEERSLKQAAIETTYHQIMALQAEQINSKSETHNTDNNISKSMGDSTNVLDFDKILKSAAV